MKILKDLPNSSQDPSYLPSPTPLLSPWIKRGPEKHSFLIQAASSYDVLSFISLKMRSWGSTWEIIGVGELMRQGHGENQKEAFSPSDIPMLCLSEHCVSSFTPLIN